MEPSDVFALTVYLADLYGSHFPALTDGMSHLWYQSLRHLDADIAHEAATRWAKRYTLKAPSLDDLLEQIEVVRDDRRQARRSGRSDTSPRDVVQNAAETQTANHERSEDDGIYGRLLASLDYKLGSDQRAEQCIQWAKEYEARRPELAASLRNAARKYHYLQQEAEILALPEHHADAQGARETDRR